MSKSKAEKSSYFGTTPPVSLAYPSSSDIECDEELHTYLISRSDIYESRDRSELRDSVVRKLASFVDEWSSRIAQDRGISFPGKSGGTCLKIFGSTRLQVHSPVADLDVLCIAPRHVSRDDFFKLFGAELKRRSDVTNFSSLTEAFTPVLKFFMDNQAVDLIFVSLFCKSIPPSINVINPKYLRGLDEQGVRSFNGSRVSEQICQLVPNFDAFCVCLRTIKHWARQRGVYSNVLGFLGGVNFAIMVAFVCQRYVHASPSTLIKKFFLVFSTWRWPNPVLLTGLEEISPADSDGKHLSVWNPKVNPKDGGHLMPVITPCYPAMNSAYNVGFPQFRLLMEEFQRGQLICQGDKRDRQVGCSEGEDASKGECEGESDRRVFSFEKLCFPSVVDFFSSHSRYVQVDICTNSQEQHRLWFGWVESRMRVLIQSLEQPPFVFCHPNANCFHRQVSRNDSQESDVQMESFVSTYFLGLSFKNGLRSVNLTASIQDFLTRIVQWDGKQEGMDLFIWPRTRGEIPSFVFDTVAEPSNIQSCTPLRKGTDLLSDGSEVKKSNSTVVDEIERIISHELVVPSTCPESPLKRIRTIE